MVGVLEPIRNGKKPISNGQMKKLFDSVTVSSFGEKAKISTNTKNDLVLRPWPIFWPAWRRESTLAYKSTILSVLAKSTSRS